MRSSLERVSLSHTSSSNSIPASGDSTWGKKRCQEGPIRMRKLKNEVWLHILKGLETLIVIDNVKGKDGEEGILSLTGNEKVLLAGS